MFKKVLIAEDLASINKAVEVLLKEKGIRKIIHSQYCDDAYLKLKKASHEGNPIDLMICDLSFKKDHRHEKISSGEVLAEKIHKEHPDIKIILYTVEDQPSIVKRIWKKNIVDAYVCKDRNGLENLENAIDSIENNQKFLSPDIEKILTQKNIVQLSDFEITILKNLANGSSQEEISQQLKISNFSPNSKSSIEKKLKDLRDDFGAKTNPHLINILKDFGLI